MDWVIFAGVACTQKERDDLSRYIRMHVITNDPEVVKEHRPDIVLDDSWMDISGDNFFFWSHKGKCLTLLAWEYTKRHKATTMEEAPMLMRYLQNHYYGNGQFYPEYPSYVNHPPFGKEVIEFLEWAPQEYKVWEGVFRAMEDPEMYEALLERIRKEVRKGLPEPVRDPWADAKPTEPLPHQLDPKWYKRQQLGGSFDTEILTGLDNVELPGERNLKLSVADFMRNRERGLPQPDVQPEIDVGPTAVVVSKPGEPGVTVEMPDGADPTEHIPAIEVKDVLPRYAQADVDMIMSESKKDPWYVRVWRFICFWK